MSCDLYTVRSARQRNPRFICLGSFWMSRFLELSCERLRFLLPFYTLSLLNSLKRLYRLAKHRIGGCVVGVSDAWS